MTDRNRDWRTFQKRWAGDGRFERFLLGSVVLHVVLAVLIGVLLSVGAPQTSASTAQEEQRKVEEAAKKEEVFQEAKKEVQAELKQQLAEENLKSFFDEVVQDFLPPEQAQSVWEDLLKELQQPLDELAGLVEGAEFDALKVEEMIQNLKEQIVDRLAAKVEKEQIEPIRRDVIKGAEELAKKLAEQYRDAVAKNLGQPAGQELARALEKAEQEAAQSLQKAGEKAAELRKQFEEAAKALGQKQAALEGQARQQAEAAGRNDTKALNQSRAETRKSRPDLAGISKGFEQARTEAGKAASQLAPQQPGVAAELKKASEGPGGEVSAALKKAMEASGKGDAKETGESVKAAREGAEKAAQSLRKLEAAIGLQQAAQKADRLARQTRAGAESAREAASEKAPAGKLNDLAKKTEEAGRAVGELAKDLEKAGQAVQELAKSASAGESAEEAGKRRELLEQARARQGKARELLEEGRKALAENRPTEAAGKLEVASKELTAIRQRLDETSERLGLKGDDTPADLQRRLEELRRQALAKYAQERVEGQVRVIALPALQKEASARLDQQLRGVKGMSQEAKDRLKSDVSRTLEKELPAKIGAREAFEKSAGQQMPGGDVGRQTLESARAATLARGAEAGVKQAIDRALPSLINSRVQGLVPPRLGPETASASAGQTELLRKLQAVRDLVKGNRKGVLGEVNGAAVAAARSMYHDRVGGLQRHRTYSWDLATYQKMAQAIKERGRVVGEELERKGVVGDTSSAEKDASLRPELVVLPPAVEEEKKTVEERKLRQPDFKTHRFTGIPQVTEDAIKIDGDLADWKGMPVLLLDPILKGTRKPALEPKNQKAYLAYCRKGLLLAVEIEDTSKALENNHPLNTFWSNDAIEVYIDTLNTKASYRGEAHTHQFVVFPFGHQSDPDAGGYEARMRSIDRKLDSKMVRYGLKDMPRASRRTDKGWVLEVLIPRAEIRGGPLKPGRIIGFNLQIDSGSDLYFYWTCASRVMSSMHPNTWGDMQLLGSDGEIALVEQDSTKTVTSIVPGQPVRVRVSDPDMNVDDTKKEKVSVTLRSGSGDTEVLILEETTPDSGIFVGAATTALNIGSKKPSVLEVFEGETVTVEYIDQVRRFGEKNTPIKANFAVGAIGTKLARE